MAIGERIRFFRMFRGMTQKELGMELGFSENTADIRVAQYENGSRTPKPKLLEELAYVLRVSPLAFTIVDIDDLGSLAHVLFAIEDRYGLTLDYHSGQIYLKVNREISRDADVFACLLDEWHYWDKKLRDGEISREEYDNWRYGYAGYPFVGYY